MAIVVYDVTNRTSFMDTARWVEDIQSERGNDVIVVLVGNGFNNRVTLLFICPPSKHSRLIVVNLFQLKCRQQD